MSKEREAFMAVYDVITRDLMADMPQGYSPVAQAYVKQLIDYNVPGGKMNRGLTVAASLCKLQKQTSEKQLFEAHVLGWCVEILQAYFLVADDIMDSSVTRRGKPCWYKNDNVGTVAINDSFILESLVYRLITHYFADKPDIYVLLLETFHEVSFQTQLGQLLDLTTQPPNATAIKLSDFTRERHREIVQYKTSYYSFYLPVKVAMILAKITDKQAFATAESICLVMGEYFQVQDDYLDCYGDEQTIGKIGTDIEDGKCSWLVVTALQIADKKQQQLIEENYGKKDVACVKRIKALYRELSLEKRFAEYEEESEKKIKQLIAKEMPQSLDREIFQDLFNKIYKRSL